jgi:phage repressor protein C with HTH and peptisase S24 domain
MLQTSGKPLWDIERGKTKKPGPKTLRAIEKVLRYEADYLVDLVHPREDAASSPANGKALEKASDQPVMRSVDAGETAEIIRLDLSLPMGPGATVEDYVEHEPLRFDLAYIQSFTRTPMHRLRIAMGVGDSMFPTLVSNDLVWIDTTQNQLVHADRIYAASINGGAAIKRLRPVAGGARILVISDNKTIEAYEVDANEVIIWGRVIRFARDL